MGLSRKELRDSVLNTTRQSNAQIGSLVNEYLNITLMEINDPVWAYQRGNKQHWWSFLRRKLTFSTANGTSDYVLDRSVDKLAILRQTNTPIRLRQISDDEFFYKVPDPTATGNPLYYRLWEQDGIATRLSAADTINVYSSSSSDSGSSNLLVSVSGYSNNIWTTETYQLTGTSPVVGSTTFDANSVIIVSKQQDTTGTITVIEASGSTTLVTLGPDERAARFKVITLYPTPDSAITMYLEYYDRIPLLENDAATPMFDSKWHYVVRLGALTKTYQYLNKEQDFISTRALYSAAVRAMVAADRAEPDFIERLEPRSYAFPFIHQRRSSDAIS